tara:strand:+ start:1691 stop:1960 length:270 start_codon:yes stop_codon:yes gene_type:complete
MILLAMLAGFVMGVVSAVIGCMRADRKMAHSYLTASQPEIHLAVPESCILADAGNQAREEERKRCAKIVDKYGCGPNGRLISEKIRSGE